MASLPKKIIIYDNNSFFFLFCFFWDLIMIDVVLEFLQLGYEKWSPERRSPELERRKREGDNEWKPAVDEFNDRLKR